MQEGISVSSEDNNTATDSWDDTAAEGTIMTQVDGTFLEHL